MSGVRPGTLATLTLTAAVRDRALALGFDRVAFGPAEPPEHGRQFERWLDAGYAGTMDYLARSRPERLDPRRLLPGARSVVAVAMVYGAAPGGGRPAAVEDRSPEAPTTGPTGTPPARGARVVRYAQGRDYHDVMRPRLRALARFIDETAGAGTRSRVAVDTSALLDRDLAARAGLGWTGKNTNLIAPDLGSYFFIGLVLTTAVLAPDAPHPDRCGTCRACLDACPTGAFVGPYVLDARRCISYLTIEHRGPIPPPDREAIGSWLFGCDVCQEVCPWNRRAPTAANPALGEPPGDLEPEALLDLDEAAFRARFRPTALWRARRSGLLRNAALVLANRGDRSAIPALERAAADTDPTVRDAARWALARLGPPGA
jgi:epoxyqueuosine reductase